MHTGNQKLDESAIIFALCFPAVIRRLYRKRLMCNVMNDQQREFIGRVKYERSFGAAVTCTRALKDKL